MKFKLGLKNTFELTSTFSSISNPLKSMLICRLSLRVPYFSWVWTCLICCSLFILSLSSTGKFSTVSPAFKCLKVWVFKKWRVMKPRPQIVQLYGRSPVCKYEWSLRVFFSAKLFPHTVHWCAFSLLWTLRWFFRAKLVKNACLQFSWVHLKGRSFVWLRSWTSSHHFPRNHFWQTLQETGLSPWPDLLSYFWLLFNSIWEFWCCWYSNSSLNIRTHFMQRNSSRFVSLLWIFKCISIENFVENFLWQKSQMNSPISWWTRFMWSFRHLTLAYALLQISQTVSLFSKSSCFSFWWIFRWDSECVYQPHFWQVNKGELCVFKWILYAFRLVKVFSHSGHDFCTTKLPCGGSMWQSFTCFFNKSILEYFLGHKSHWNCLPRCLLVWWTFNSVLEV